MLSRKIAQLLARGNVSTQGVFTYLQEHGLLDLLPHIHKHLKEIRAKEITRNTLVIESPFPLSEKAVGNIQHLIGGGAEEVRTTLNTELLAGFVARFKDKEYDRSAKTIITNFIRN